MHITVPVINALTFDILMCSGQNVYAWAPPPRVPLSRVPGHSYLSLRGIVPSEIKLLLLFTETYDIRCFVEHKRKYAKE